jgi:hypothetical protein
MFSIGSELPKEIPYNVDIRPSLNMQTKIRLTYSEVRGGLTDVISIVTNEYNYPLKSISSSPTAHDACGYGYDLYCLIHIRFAGASFFAAIDFWSGCLSYDGTDRESRLWYSDSLTDLVDHMIDPDKRKQLLETQDISRYTKYLSAIEEILPRPLPYLVVMPFLSFGLF